MTTNLELAGESSVSSDDLKRIAELASMYAAAQDALNEDMISRLSNAFSEGITLLDRMTRNQGLMRLLQVLDHPDVQDHLMSLANSFSDVTKEIANAPPAKGGVSGLLKIAMDPGTQEGLRAVSIMGKRWGEELRGLKEGKASN